MPTYLHTYLRQCTLIPAISAHDRPNVYVWFSTTTYAVLELSLFIFLHARMSRINVE